MVEAARDSRDSRDSRVWRWLGRLEVPFDLRKVWRRASVPPSSRVLC